MVNELLDRLAEKTLTKDELFKKVKNNYDLLPEILDGMNSSKAAVRYGCGKVLMDISKDYPDKLYPYMDIFIGFLESKYRILIWQAMAIIANLTKVDKNKKFDEVFEKYYSFINNDYMVTVANLVGHSGKIALAKPYLVNKITNELLKVENLNITPHLTIECKKIIVEQAILSLNMFFDKIENKEKVISFVKNQLNSSRKTLRSKAEEFLNKWNNKT